MVIAISEKRFEKSRRAVNKEKRLRVKKLRLIEKKAHLNVDKLIFLSIIYSERL